MRFIGRAHDMAVCPSELCAKGGEHNGQAAPRYDTPTSPGIALRGLVGPTPTPYRVSLERAWGNARAMTSLHCEETKGGGGASER